MGNVLLVALEHHFLRCPNSVYTDLAFAYDYWREYLEVFDKVVVVARVKKSGQKPDGMLRADGERVRFFDIADYHGGRSFVRNAPKVLQQALNATKQADHYLLRAGNIGAMVWFWLMLRRKSYAMECMGQVKEALVTERPKTLMYTLISNIGHSVCKAQVRFACCVSYTSNFLRRTYPHSKGREFVFSGVRLSDDIITSARPEVFFKQRPFKFVSVGRVELQKGHIWLVEAAAELAKQVNLPEWTLDIVGPGSQVSILRERVRELGLDKVIRVVGGLRWGPDLFAYLDNSHLFVLPSLTEGMPRALIEGMARGITAIGSNTGGVPELLSTDDLVETGDVTGLADKMAKCMTDPVRLARMSERNFKRAQGFRIELTKAKKLAFWKYIRENV